MTEIQEKSLTEQAYHCSYLLLIACVWGSSLIFGFYILAFYLGAAYDGDLTKWNDLLPKIYEPNTRTASVGIGIHFAGGGIILILGFLQFIKKIRDAFPLFHKIIGRIYVTVCLITSIGGLLFIATKGTIGGPVMNVGFSLYGILMIGAAIMTARKAMQKDFEKHQEWAMYLFALAIGSWLYRMYYGFWLQLTDDLGHTKDFRGAFDYLMGFFFYVPNLAITRLMILNKRKNLPTKLYPILGIIVFNFASFFILYGSYFFTKLYWAPAILNRIGL